MAVKSVVLSGMSLAEITPADRLGFTTRLVDANCATLAGFLDGAAEGRDFFTVNLGPANNNRPTINRGQAEELVTKLMGTAPIYMTVDTYLALVCQLGLVKPESIAGVFPYPATEPCKFTPRVTPESDAICRNVALYFWNLHHRQMQDWSGTVRAFPHRASNTISFRAKAPYHSVERSQRGLIQPVDPNQVTLQFDWSAAEFNLILQHLGYTPPEDAYGEFVKAGLDRSTTKLTLLQHIYGSSDERLETKIGSGDTVQAILQQLDVTYPLVSEWRNRCINCRMADFHGFTYDLGDVEYKRPNRWAQTALQLCKWELMSRLVVDGLHDLGAGDLHDQLFFAVDPVQHQERVRNLIGHIRKPAFGRYDLRPQFKKPAKTWGSD